MKKTRASNPILEEAGRFTPRRRVFSGDRRRRILANSTPENRGHSLSPSFSPYTPSRPNPPQFRLAGSLSNGGHNASGARESLPRRQEKSAA